MSRLPFAPAVDELTVDIETATLSFETRPGTTCDPEQLRAAVREAGFGIGAVQVDGKAAGVMSDAASEPRSAD